jgi:hypothetical protein
MNKLAGERVLFESENKTLVLTTHRVRFETQSTGFASIKSIMLEEVASCMMIRTSQPVLLVFAALFGLAGITVPFIARGLNAALPLGVAVALIFVALYFASRRQFLSVASAGTTIRVSTGKMNAQAVSQLIDALEWAKNERYLAGQKTQYTQYAT